MASGMNLDDTEGRTGMKILYVSWGESTKNDTVDALKALGYEVEVLAYAKVGAYDEWPRLLGDGQRAIERGCKALFSYDYLPDLSRLGEKNHVPYISWLYDCPVLTAQSVTITNDCNYVFSFDKRQCEAIRRRGARHVYYLPLGVNWDRLNSSKNVGGTYRNEVSFMGNLYDDERFHLSQIEYLPPRLRGHLDALVAAQARVYGMPLIEDAMDDTIIAELATYAKVDLGSHYNQDTREVFSEWLYKAATVRERRHLLKVVGGAYPLTVASQKEPTGINCRFVGYLDYEREMPDFFRGSRINLNFTLRSITHGIPLRVLDAMAAGGFVLSNYQPAFEELFENGRELVWFYNEKDMMEKIRYYLGHEEERAAVARNGALAARGFSYRNQLSIMMEIVEGEGLAAG